MAQRKISGDKYEVEDHTFYRVSLVQVIRPARLT